MTFGQGVERKWGKLEDTAGPPKIYIILGMGGEGQVRRALSTFGSREEACKSGKVMMKALQFLPP